MEKFIVSEEKQNEMIEKEKKARALKVVKSEEPSVNDGKMLFEAIGIIPSIYTLSLFSEKARTFAESINNWELLLLGGIITMISVDFAQAVEYKVKKGVGMEVSANPTEVALKAVSVAAMAGYMLAGYQEASPELIQMIGNAAMITRTLAFISVLVDNYNESAKKFVKDVLKKINSFNSKPKGKHNV